MAEQESMFTVANGGTLGLVTLLFGWLFAKQSRSEDRVSNMPTRAEFEKAHAELRGDQAQLWEAINDDRRLAAEHRERVATNMATREDMQTLTRAVNGLGQQVAGLSGRLEGVQK